MASANNSDFDENVIKALITIKDFCNNRHNKCEGCQLSNYEDQCLVYEFPHLWNVKPTTTVKFMSDK